MKYLLLFLVLFSGNLYADFRHLDAWDNEEKAIFSFYVATTYIDIKQTEYALDHPCACYLEGNPIYGSHTPSISNIVLINVASSAFLYYTIGKETTDRKTRNTLWLTNAVKFGVVYNNHMIGAHWKVAF